MAEKITVSSTNPEFLDFPQWVARKIADFRGASQFASADQVQAALDAKKAAETAAGWAPISVEGTVYTVPSAVSPTTPEFELLWTEWKTEYDVNILIENI